MNVNYDGINTPYSNSKTGMAGDLRPIIRRRWVKFEFIISFSILSSSSLASIKEEFAANMKSDSDVSSLIDFLIFINLLSAL